MNPSASDPQPLPASQAVPLEKETDVPSQRGLLEEVLARTGRITMQSEASPDAKAELETLRRITLRHRGELQLSESVLAEWVAAMLHDHFAAWSDSDAFLSAAASQIAQTLGGDPSAYQRLQGLWRHLADETSREGNA